MSTHPSPPDVRLYTFGSPRLVVDGRVVKTNTRAALALLVYLACEDRPHQRDWLARFLWSETSVDSARVLLRNALHGIRRLSGTDIIVSDRTTVALNRHEHFWSDIEAFQNASRNIAVGPETAGTFSRSAVKVTDIPVAESAIELQPAPFLSGFEVASSAEFESWVMARRRELGAALGRAYQSLIELYAVDNRLERAIHYALAWLSHDGANEKAHRLLMTLYAADGDRSSALRQFQRCRDTLARTFGATPSAETLILRESIEEGRRASILTRPRTQAEGFLPKPLAVMIGRSDELRLVSGLLSSSRVTTITGVGGSGKTTLAVEAAHLCRDGYRDGAWFVELASVESANLVPEAIGAVLGVRPKGERTTAEHIAQFARNLQMLLILDNCEHLVASCAQVVECLARNCPEMTVLATSREPLGLPNEALLRIPCLRFPPLDGHEKMILSDVSQYPAVSLFVERARMVEPSFGITNANAASIIEICHAVEGLPLAIELIARQTEAIAPDQSLRQVKSGAWLCPGGEQVTASRHRTMRSVIDWSDRLLSDAERLVLRRLSVFHNGWTIESAIRVCGDGQTDDAVVGVLARLVNASLVQPPEDGRYRFLEPVLQFARDGLDADGSGGEVAARHRRYFRGYVEETSRGIYSGQQDVSLSLIDVEYANIRAAIRSAVTAGAVRDLLSFGVSLYWYWFVRELVPDGLACLRPALELIQRPGDRLSARAFSAAGFLSWWIGQQDIGRGHAEMGLRWAVAHGDPEDRGFAFYAAAQSGSPPATPDAFEQLSSHLRNSVASYREADDRWGLALSLYSSAVTLVHRRELAKNCDLAAARAWFREAEEIATSMDDQIALAKMHYWMAILELVSRDDRESARAYLLNTTEHQSDRCAPVDVAMSQMTLAQLESDEGHHRSALRRLQESARLLLRCGNGACMANVIAQAGVVCFWLGHTDSATQLLEYYRSARSAPQTPPEGYLAYIQETADKSRYRRNIEVGRAMSSRDAVDLVLSTA